MGQVGYLRADWQSAQTARVKTDRLLILEISMIVNMTGGKQIGQLSECERLRLLRIFDEVIPQIPERSLLNVEKELSSLRTARRVGGRNKKLSPSRR